LPCSERRVLKHKKELLHRCQAIIHIGGPNMVHDFIINSIENVYNHKTVETKKNYEEEINDLEIERMVLIFIIDDINNNCRFGNKNSNNSVTYKSKHLIKEVKAKEAPISLERKCVETLKGLGIKAEKDWNSITVYLDN
jgi:hypothetical protein